MKGKLKSNPGLGRFLDVPLSYGNQNALDWKRKQRNGGPAILGEFSNSMENMGISFSSKFTVLKIGR